MSKNSLSSSTRSASAYSSSAAIGASNLTRAQLLALQNAEPPAPSIIDGTLIPHTAFAKALKRMRACFLRADGISNPQCILLLGDTGTGKTTVQETFFASHPPKRLADGLWMPILRVKVPSDPSVKSFVKQLLVACEDPMAFKTESESNKTDRLKVLMKAMGTKMIQVDEANHFIDKGRALLAHKVADWFKLLIDDTKVSVAASGIPVAEALLAQNEQLARRFLAPVYLPRFRWADPEQRKEFTHILHGLHSALAREFDMPELHAQGMAFRCYAATGGLVGLLTKFLSVTEQDARADGRKTITLADMEDALADSIEDAGLRSAANPFSRSFEPVPTADLLERIDRIGIAEFPKPNPRRSKRTFKKDGLKQVF